MSSTGVETVAEAAFFGQQKTIRTSSISVLLSYEISKSMITIQFVTSNERRDRLAANSYPLLTEAVIELNWVLFGAPEQTNFCIRPGSSDLISGLEWI